MYSVIQVRTNACLPKLTSQKLRGSNHGRGASMPASLAVSFPPDPGVAQLREHP